MTNEIIGKAVLKNLGDVVANKHLGKCVIVRMTDIQVAESQTMIDTKQYKYCFLSFSSVHEK